MNMTLPDTVELQLPEGETQNNLAKRETSEESLIEKRDAKKKKKIKQRGHTLFDHDEDDELENLFTAFTK